MNYEAGMFGRNGDQLALEGDYGRKRRWPWIVGILLVVAILAVAFVMMRAPQPAAKGAAKGAPGAAAAGQKKGGNDQMPTVTYATPGITNVEIVVTGTGTLAAKREMPVGVAGEGGQVTRVLVEPGSWVQAGQVLATVDRSVQSNTAESQAAQVRVARADATLAEADLKRAQSLVGRGFVSKADIDRKTATRDAAVARVRVAESQLNETRARNRRLDIRAPAAGLVLTRAVEPGQIISAGSGVLFRIAAGGQMELRAQLSEADLQRVHSGVGAQVTPVGGAQVFNGTVWQVSPVIDPQNRQGIARIQLSYNPALRPGGFASARIVAGGQQAVILPQSAVQTDEEGKNFVYILIDCQKNKKGELTQCSAQRKPVTTGDVSEQGVAIPAGLDGSEMVVLTAGAFLTPNQKVIPVKQGTK
ncbi:efflux RND transporter periplasmic adaptor subunit [Sphingomonas sp. LB-2]|uniref:efflux RND transporter periplasmic adaptor subunit n=1 Tax=Sphingomonas caeni TaxID=2984949 RepID=UPI00222FB14E|nr:efflux RND transporter periplasmic adaptor subunit [Sphingomonas caeni]MCW3846679.1 efflux RND transporter periplasmic adaptor subunit [Sphingomonas caeni]